MIGDPVLTKHFALRPLVPANRLEVVIRSAYFPQLALDKKDIAIGNPVVGCRVSKGDTQTVSQKYLVALNRLSLRAKVTFRFLVVDTREGERQGFQDPKPSFGDQSGRECRTRITNQYHISSKHCRKN